MRFSYDLNENSTVLDLGGYEGQWASDIFAMYCCRVLVFEPVLDFAANIRERFKHNPRITVYPFGLGSRTKTSIIGVCRDASSVFRTSGPTQEIQIVDAAEWISKERLADIDLVKINIEGGEYELLERLLEVGMISRIRNLQVQFHAVSNDSTDRMNRIQSRLARTHRPTYQYTFVWENWVRLPPPA